ncbi:TIR domain-containing protein [Aliarcobacter butzleri]|uniref:TIR domain-containing protein n=1 Tax=Aliarcobacter butzleri TaxID=28197 RepID=UPI0012612285|nr:TIR domain-containing protein [Aliarcobacter butzleri]MCT7614882.1 TIR domain-containing protein [Aliarcobacter butzleri]
MSNKHKVFISYHHANDEEYKKEFVETFGKIFDGFIDKSVSAGDIDSNLKTETIRQKIRDDFIRDATVTIVLIGAETWKRKHVDWEISSSIRETEKNPRTGLIGILLPSYSDFSFDSKTLDYLPYNKYTIPPRLSDNIDCGFAKIYDWSENHDKIKEWIHDAFERRNKINPDNSFPSFKNNKYAEKWQR